MRCDPGGFQQAVGTCTNRHVDKSEQFQINIWSARGGHGATTVAGAIARFLETTVRSDDPDAFKWI